MKNKGPQIISNKKTTTPSVSPSKQSSISNSSFLFDSTSSSNFSSVEEEVKQINLDLNFLYHSNYLFSIGAIGISNCFEICIARVDMSSCIFYSAVCRR